VTPGPRPPVSLTALLWAVLPHLATSAPLAAWGRVFGTWTKASPNPSSPPLPPSTSMGQRGIGGGGREGWFPHTKLVMPFALPEAGHPPPDIFLSEALARTVVVLADGPLFSRALANLRPVLNARRQPAADLPVTITLGPPAFNLAPFSKWPPDLFFFEAIDPLAVYPCSNLVTLQMSWRFQCFPPSQQHGRGGTPAPPRAARTGPPCPKGLRFLLGVWHTALGGGDPAVVAEAAECLMPTDPPPGIARALL